MMRRVAAGLVLTGLATIILVELERPASIALWVVLVVAALVVAGWRRWPERPDSSPSLVPSPVRGRRRQPLQLAALELEVAAAVDPLLGGERPMRRRLARLTEQRAGMPVGSLDRVTASELLGPESGARLLEPAAPLTVEGLEEIVTRIERL
jgi:hypothetical protein